MAFRTYARAVTDENERKRLRSLYVFKIVLLILGIFFIIAEYVCLVLFALSFVAQIAAGFFAENAEIIIPPAFPITFSVLAVLIVGSITGFIIISAKFSAELNRICAITDEDSVIPEVIEYRKKLSAYRQTSKKEILKALTPLFVCLPLYLTLFVVNFIFPIWVLSFLSMVIIYAGVLISLFALIFRAIRKSVRGETFGAQTAKESEVIDALSGIKRDHPFPDNKGKRDRPRVFLFDDLNSEANELKKAAIKRTVIVFLSAATLFFIAIPIDILLFGGSYIRLIPSVFIILSYLSFVAALSPLAKKKNDLIKEYEKRLSLDEKFAPDLLSFKRYLKRAKAAKIVLSASFFVGAAISFSGFVFYANYLSYVVCFAIILIGALLGAALLSA